MQLSYKRTNYCPMKHQVIFTIFDAELHEEHSILFCILAKCPSWWKVAVESSQGDCRSHGGGGGWRTTNILHGSLMGSLPDDASLSKFQFEFHYCNSVSRNDSLFLVKNLFGSVNFCCLKWIRETSVRSGTRVIPPSITLSLRDQKEPLVSLLFLSVLPKQKLSNCNATKGWKENPKFQKPSLRQKHS